MRYEDRKSISLGKNNKWIISGCRLQASTQMDLLVAHLEDTSHE